MSNKIITPRQAAKDILHLIEKIADEERLSLKQRKLFFALAASVL